MSVPGATKIKVLYNTPSEVENISKYNTYPPAV